MLERLNALRGGPVLAEDGEIGKITDFYTKESGSATMTFLVTETEYRDDDGDLVVTARMNLIHRK